MEPQQCTLLNLDFNYTSSQNNMTITSDVEAFIRHEIEMVAIDPNSSAAGYYIIL